MLASSIFKRAIRPESQRLRHLLLLIGTQIGLLGAGFWIFRCFLVSAVYRAAEDAAVAGLAGEMDEFLRTARRPEFRDPATGATDWAEVSEAVFAGKESSGARWALADLQWNVVTILRSPQSANQGSHSSEKSLSWATPLSGVGDGSGAIWGRGAVASEPHVAVARRLDRPSADPRDGVPGDREGLPAAPPVAGRAGYLVAHRPVTEVQLTPAALVGSLPAAVFIAWIWTGAMLAVAIYMIVARFYDKLTRRRAQTEATALRQVHSLVRTRDAVIFGLAKLAESRDTTTGHHLERISAYAVRLAKATLRHAKYREAATPEFVRLIGLSSALHDIGKVGIEDSVLRKDGPLTEAELTHVQEHTLIGGNCLLEIEKHLGASNFLEMARQIALSHHEHWDGAGYPRGLIGREIPLAARIVAIADVYDALSTARPYKSAFPHEKCVEMIREEAGKQFDPDLVAIFLTIERAFDQIARQYANDAPVAPRVAPSMPTFDEGMAPSHASVSLGGIV